MANEPRKPTGTWMTGKNVRTAEPDKDGGLKNVDAGVPADVAAGVEEPTDSANKPEWYAYRRGQGYTEQQLETLTKAQLQDLPDDPNEFVPEDEDDSEDDEPSE